MDRPTPDSVEYEGSGRLDRKGGWGRIGSLLLMILGTCLPWLNPLGAVDLIWGYHIGNSLTGNSILTQLEDSFARNGRVPTVAWHLDFSQSAAGIAANPAGVDGLDGSREPFGGWSNALTGYSWDYVTIQSYYSSSGLAEVAGFQTLIDACKGNSANARTRIYLYQVWPWMPWDRMKETYGQLWSEPYPGLDQAAVPNRQYFERLRERLKADNPTIPMGLIPVGEVLAALDVSLQAKSIPIIGRTLTSAWDLYGDFIHLTKEGSYVAHMTVLSTILNRHPDDIAVGPTVLSSASPEFRAVAHQAIWSVLQSPPLTIAPDGSGGMRVSWAPSIPGFVLQEAPFPDAEIWTDLPTGDGNTLVVPILSSERFYRLFKP